MVTAIISGVVALVGLGLKYAKREKDIAAANQQQANFAAGTPQKIVEIRQWKHHTNSPFNINDYHIWVKVPDLRYFAAKTQVTIKDSATQTTKHGGLYDVVDVWKDFPKKDPEIELRNAIGISTLFFLPKNFENVEKLPFQHTERPGVLKLRPSPKAKIHHGNEGGGATIFTGSKVIEENKNTSFKETFAGYVSERQAAVNDWFTNTGETITEKAEDKPTLIIAISVIILIIIILLTLNTNKK